MHDDVMDFNLRLEIAGNALFVSAVSTAGEAGDQAVGESVLSGCAGLDGRALGERLFHRLLPGAVHDLYQRCRGSLGRAGRLRVRIGAAIRSTPREVLRVHAVPWELVHDPGGDEFLALDPRVQLVRYVSLPSPVPDPLALGSRDLEVLVAAACPAGQVALRWEDECAAIERAFAGTAVRVTVLPRATRASLREALATQRHAVLHFIGHGSGPTRDRPGGIGLEADAGGTDWISARELALIARGTTALRVVVLNACRTAAVAAGSHGDLAESVGPSLALRGVPAVVAMTRAVRDDDAVGFAHTLYTQLGRGATLEAAVHAGRIAARVDHARGWTIPVLFSRMAASPPANVHRPERADRVENTTVVDAKQLHVRGRLDVAACVLEAGSGGELPAGSNHTTFTAGEIVCDTATIGAVIDRRRREPR